MGDLRTPGITVPNSKVPDFRGSTQALRKKGLRTPNLTVPDFRGSTQALRKERLRGTSVPHHESLCSSSLQSCCSPNAMLQANVLTGVKTRISLRLLAATVVFTTRALNSCVTVLSVQFQQTNLAKILTWETKRQHVSVASVFSNWLNYEPQKSETQNAKACRTTNRAGGLLSEAPAVPSSGIPRDITAAAVSS